MGAIHCKVNPIGKNTGLGGGRSVVAAAAYRLGLRLIENVVVDGVNTTVEHDYLRKGNVAFAGVIAPENSPEWVYDVNEFWQRVTDRDQHRDGARYAREIVLALPKKLSKEMQHKLVKEIINEEIIPHNLVTNYGMHMDKGNPHAHIMIAVRSIENGKFSKKQNQYLNNPASVRSLRKACAERMENALIRGGYYDRVRHESYEDLDVEMEATVHEGYAARARERVTGEKGILLEENRNIRVRNFERMLKNPSIFVKYMSANYHIFSEKDIAKELYTFAEKSNRPFDEAYHKLYARVMQDISLNDMKMVDGRYDSKQYREPENVVLYFEEEVQNIENNIAEYVENNPSTQTKNINRIIKNKANDDVKNNNNFTYKEHFIAPKLLSEVSPDVTDIAGKIYESYDADMIKQEMYEQADSIYGLAFKRDAQGWYYEGKNNADESLKKLRIYRNNPNKIISHKNSNISYSAIEFWASLHGYYDVGGQYRDIIADLAGRLGVSKTYQVAAVKKQKNIVSDTEKKEAVYVPVEMSNTQLSMWKLIHDGSKKAFRENREVRDYLINKRGYGEIIDKLELGVISDRDRLFSYLKKQGFSAEDMITISNRIGSSHTLVIPYVDDGDRAIGVIARDIDWQKNDKGIGKYIFSRDMQKGRTLFGIERLQGEELSVVEGPMDVLVLRAHGIDNIVALGGAGISEAQIGLLNHKGVRKVNLCLDGDEAGKIGMEGIIPRLLDANIEVDVTELVRAKDPDDYIREYGIDAFKEEFRERKSGIDYLLGRIEISTNKSKIVNDLMRVAKNLDDKKKEEIFGVLDKYIIRDEYFELRERVYENIEERRTAKVIRFDEIQRRYDLDKINELLASNVEKYFADKFVRDEDIWVSKDGIYSIHGTHVTNNETKKSINILNHWLTQNHMAFGAGVAKLAGQMGIEKTIVTKPAYKRPEITDIEVNMWKAVERYSKHCLLELAEDGFQKQEVKNYLRGIVGEEKVQGNFEIGVIDNHNKLINYLEQEGFTEEYTSKISYAFGKNYKLVSSVRNDRGEVVGIYGIDTRWQGDSKYPAKLYSCKPYLKDMVFGIEDVKNSTAILVQDMRHKIALDAKGIKNVVVVENEITANHLALLKEKDIEHITLFVEENKIAELSVRLLEQGISVSVPNNSLDVAAYIKSTNSVRIAEDMGQFTSGIKYIADSFVGKDRTQILQDLFEYEQKLTKEDNTDLRRLAIEHSIRENIELGLNIESDPIVMADKIVKGFIETARIASIDEIKEGIEYIVDIDIRAREYQIDRELGRHVLYIGENWYVDKRAVYKDINSTISQLPHTIDKIAARRMMVEASKVIFSQVKEEQRENYFQIGDHFIDKTASFIAKEYVIDQAKKTYNLDIRNELEEMISTEFRPYMKAAIKVLDKLTQESAVFTREMLTREIRQHVLVETENRYDKAYVEGVVNEVIKHNHVIKLTRSDFFGKEYLTTHTQLKREKDIVDKVKILNERSSVKIKLDGLNEFIDKTILNDSQKIGLKHILKGNDITVIEGWPGSGKSTVLGVLKEYLDKNSNAKIIGLAANGIAALGIEEKGIESQTFRSWELSNDKKIGSGDIIVVDEAAVLNTRQYEKLLNIVTEKQAKLILIGDISQSQPVNEGQMFRICRDVCGSVSFDQIVRQKEKWQREASVDFANGNFIAGLSKYDVNGNISFCKSFEEMKHDVVKEYLEYSGDDKLIITYTNDEAKAFNRIVRSKLIENGIITETESKYAIGDEVIFKKNEYKQYNIRNGMRGKVEKYLSAVGVKLDENGHIVEEAKNRKVVVALRDSERKIEVDIDTYKDLQHAYAVTGDSCQGISVKGKTFPVINKNMDSSRSIVNLTRHTMETQIYTYEFSDIEHMANRIGRDNLAKNALDYNTHRAQLSREDTNYARVENYIQTDGMIKALVQEIGAKNKNIFATTDDEMIELYAMLKEQREKRIAGATDILSNLKMHRRYLQDGGIKTDKLKYDADLKDKKVSNTEAEEIYNLIRYKDDGNLEAADSLSRGMARSYKFYQDKLKKYDIDVKALYQDAMLYNDNSLAGEFAKHENKHFGTEEIGYKGTQEFIDFAQTVIGARKKYNTLLDNMAVHNKLIEKELEYKKIHENDAEKCKLAEKRIDKLSNNKIYENHLIQKTELEKYLGRFKREEDYTQLVDIHDRVVKIHEKRVEREKLVSHDEEMKIADLARSNVYKRTDAEIEMMAYNLYDSSRNVKEVISDEYTIRWYMKLKDKEYSENELKHEQKQAEKKEKDQNYKEKPYEEKQKWKHLGKHLVENNVAIPYTGLRVLYKLAKAKEKEDIRARHEYRSAVKEVENNVKLTKEKMIGFVTSMDADGSRKSIMIEHIIKGNHKELLDGINDLPIKGKKYLGIAGLEYRKNKQVKDDLEVHYENLQKAEMQRREITLSEIRNTKDHKIEDSVIYHEALTVEMTRRTNNEELGADIAQQILTIEVARRNSLTKDEKDKIQNKVESVDNIVNESMKKALYNSSFMHPREMVDVMRKEKEMRLRAMVSVYKNMKKSDEIIKHVQDLRQEGKRYSENLVYDLSDDVREFCAESYMQHKIKYGRAPNIREEKNIVIAAKGLDKRMQEYEAWKDVQKKIDHNLHEDMYSEEMFKEHIKKEARLDLRDKNAGKMLRNNYELQKKISMQMHMMIKKGNGFAYDRVYKLNHQETEKLHERMAIEHAQDQIRLSQGPKFRM